MPSVSKKQHGFMAAVANNPKFAKKVGVSKSVGEEFMKADKGRKFKAGGLKEVDSDLARGFGIAAIRYRRLRHVLLGRSARSPH